MPTVNFKINSKNYSVDCGPGQENQILSIANQIDAKVQNLSSMFGDVDSETLLLMVCILTFGDIQKSKTKIATLESQITNLEEKITELQTKLVTAQNSATNEDEIADVIKELTEKVKRISKLLLSTNNNQTNNSSIIDFK